MVDSPRFPTSSGIDPKKALKFSILCVRNESVIVCLRSRFYHAKFSPRRDSDVRMPPKGNLVKFSSSILLRQSIPNDWPPLQVYIAVWRLLHTCGRIKKDSRVFSIFLGFGVYCALYTRITITVSREESWGVCWSSEDAPRHRPARGWMYHTREGETETSEVLVAFTRVTAASVHFLYIQWLCCARRNIAKLGFVCLATGGASGHEKHRGVGWGCNDGADALTMLCTIQAACRRASVSRTPI